jgi:hypothetical protein
MPAKSSSVVMILTSSGRVFATASIASDDGWN